MENKPNSEYNKGEGYLFLMKMYGEEYLEAHNSNMEDHTKEMLKGKYQFFRNAVKDMGADVSKYPENLEELTN